MNAYEKSRAINFAVGAASFKDASSAKVKAEYERSFYLSMECVPDATRNGIPQEFIARQTKGSDRYELFSHSYETFYAGDVITCYDSHWVVTDVEAYKNVYTKGYMKRCNLFLKAMVKDKLVERWAVIDPGSFTTTVKEMLYMTRLDKEFKLYLPLDMETRNIKLGTRFAVGRMPDDDGRDALIVFRVTGYDPTDNFGDDHLLILNCKSDSYDPSVDNLELGICDYRASEEPPVGARCEITYSGDPIVRVGGAAKKVVSTYYNAANQRIDVDDTVWQISTVDETGLTADADGNQYTIKLGKDAIPGSLYSVKAQSATAGCEATIVLKAVTMLG